MQEDLTGNSVYDPSSAGLSGIPVTQGINTTFTNADGFFALPYQSNVPVSISYDQTLWPVITTPNPNNAQSYDWPLFFGLSADDPVYEITSQFSSGTPFICGNNFNQSFTVFNTGNQPTTAQVVFTFDPLLTYLSAVPSPTAVNGNELTFESSEIGYGQFEHIQITFLNDTSLFGELAQFSYEIFTAGAGGMLVSTDSGSTIDSLYCAYDPNDIYGFPLGDGAPGFITADTPLDYRIRFQNTGNFPAQIVVVEEYIPEELDLSTLVPGWSSHEHYVTIDSESRIARWTFPDIQLPDSASDPDGSIGTIWYKIDMASGLQLGDEINCTAAIYFDQNAAVITNTSLHTISQVLSTDLKGRFTTTSVFPNPTAGRLDVTSSVQWESYEIYDMLGRRIKAGKIIATAFRIDLSELEGGVYTLLLLEPLRSAIETHKILKR